MLCLGFCLSCTKAENPVSSSEEVLLEFQFSLPEYETKAEVGSTSIYDVNIFYFHKIITTFKAHTYRDSQSANLLLLSGEYDVYIIANYGENLESLSKPELESLMSNKSLDTHQVLAYKGTRTVTTDQTEVISLTRTFTKTKLKVNVSQTNSITLKAVELINRPKNCRLFGDSKITSIDNVDDVVRVEATDKSFVDEFVMFENLQDPSSDFDLEIDKNPTNSPEFATYFRITASDGAEQYYIYIFLGQTLGNNYQVKRNLPLEITVNIIDKNTVDTRIEFIDVVINDLRPSYVVGESIEFEISNTVTNNYGSSLKFLYTHNNSTQSNLFIKKSANEEVELLPNTEYPLLNDGVYKMYYKTTKIEYPSFDIVVKDERSYSYKKRLITRVIEAPYRTYLYPNRKVHQPNYINLYVDDIQSNYKLLYRIEGDLAGTVSNQADLGVMYLNKNTGSTNKGDVVLPETAIEINSQSQLNRFVFYPHKTSLSSFRIIFTITSNDVNTEKIVDLGAIGSLNLPYRTSPDYTFDYSVLDPALQPIETPYTSVQSVTSNIIFEFATTETSGVITDSDFPDANPIENLGGIQPLNVDIDFALNLNIKYAQLNVGAIYKSNYKPSDIVSGTEVDKSFPSTSALPAFSDTATGLLTISAPEATLVNKVSADPDGKILYSVHSLSWIYGSGSNSVTNATLPENVSISRVEL